LSPKLLTDAIVITSLGATDYDFTEETNTKEESSKQPREAHVGPCQIHDPLHKKLAALILKTSSEDFL
jgi:hypothetical protein